MTKLCAKFPQHKKPILNPGIRMSLVSNAFINTSPPEDNQTRKKKNNKTQTKDITEFVMWALFSRETFTNSEEYIDEQYALPHQIQQQVFAIVAPGCYIRK